jgi:hypothetical protein
MLHAQRGTVKAASYLALSNVCLVFGSPTLKYLEELEATLLLEWHPGTLACTSVIDSASQILPRIKRLLMTQYIHLHSSLPRPSAS